MFKIIYKLLVLMMLTGLTPLLADTQVLLAGAAMDHSGREHSKMERPKMNEMKMDHDMKAMEMDHDMDGMKMDHDMKGHESMSSRGGSKAAKTDKTAAKLAVLKAIPASGKAREAGFDNSYLMKYTTEHASMRDQCVLASRGIIMLDKASWQKCSVQTTNAER